MLSISNAIDQPERNLRYWEYCVQYQESAYKDFAHTLFSLNDSIAFVTGTGSGIGQTIAYGLASARAKVACFDLRTDGGFVCW